MGVFDKLYVGSSIAATVLSLWRWVTLDEV